MFLVDELKDVILKLGAVIEDIGSGRNMLKKIGQTLMNAGNSEEANERQQANSDVPETHIPRIPMVIIPMEKYEGFQNRNTSDF